MAKKQTCKAFSLAELSIVLIIIGILVAGVSTGSKVITQAKLKSAKVLTNSARILEIEGDNMEPSVVLWFDATDTSYIVKDSNDNVSQWKSRVGDNLVNSLLQPTADNQPQYQRVGMGIYPSIYFDGNDSLTAVAPILSNFTDADDSWAVVIVFSQAVSLQYYLFDLKGIRMKTRADGVVDFQDALGEHRVYNYRLDSPNYMLINIDNSAGSGASVVTSQYVNLEGPSSTTGDINDGTHSNMLIGAGIGNDLVGYISEVIVFNDTLSVDDIAIVRNYLQSKYRIN